MGRFIKKMGFFLFLPSDPRTVTRILSDWRLNKSNGHRVMSGEDVLVEVQHKSSGHIKPLFSLIKHRPIGLLCLNGLKS